jgi:hypothetical protein
LGGWLKGNGAAERFEPGDQAAGLAFGVLAADEVVGAELVVGFASGRFTLFSWETSSSRLGLT